MSSASEDSRMSDAGNLVEDDLFGEDQDVETPRKVRELSDEDLDSGDDEARNDRVRLGSDQDKLENTRSAVIADAVVCRLGVPKSRDGKYRTLRLPRFASVDPRLYDPETFVMPELEHHRLEQTPNFSAAATSASTMRCRMNSDDQLESNTVIYKWSDGSTTIGIGDQQYEMDFDELALAGDKYEETKDSMVYVSFPSMTAQCLLVIGHLKGQYTMKPNREVEDDALEKLQRSLAAASRKEDKLLNYIPSQDPEERKKQAEALDREFSKKQRAKMKGLDKASTSTRRMGGGLTVDDLEGRSRKAPAARGAARSSKPRRRSSDYDSDDDMPHGRNEYDRTDDWLADSDEEIEEEGADRADEDEEEEELEDSDADRRKKSRKNKPSRKQSLSDADADADGEADVEEDIPAATSAAAEGGRARKRQIVEDDDDE